MQADLTEITGADKYCYTGFQFGWMSVVDNIWMFGQNFHAGKKEIKLGDEKSGWAYQTAIVPTPGVSLSGRYSPDMTSMSGSFDLGLLGNGALNINLSEQPEKQLWDLSLGIHGIGRTCYSYRTQSLLYHNFSWACSLWETNGTFFATFSSTVMIKKRVKEEIDDDELDPPVEVIISEAMKFLSAPPQLLNLCRLLDQNQNPLLALPYERY